MIIIIIIIIIIIETAYCISLLFLYQESILHQAQLSKFKSSLYRNRDPINVYVQYVHYWSQTQMCVENKPQVQVVIWMFVIREGIFNR